MRNLPAVVTGWRDQCAEVMQAYAHKAKRREWISIDRAQTLPADTPSLAFEVVVSLARA